MSDVNVLLGLAAQTAIHAGAGTSVGAIDLPIQREAHTQWPCVYGSAVKGALRAAARRKKIDEETVLFGPEIVAGTGSEHAGALSVGDAKLLLLPLPTLDRAFRWVTCPSLLERYRRDAGRLGFAVDTLPRIDHPDDETALGIEGDPTIYLLEYRLGRSPHADLAPWVKAIAALAGRDEREIAASLTVVSDALFNHLCRHGTPVAAHVRLDPDTKTVKNGALWYEETLPPETMLYVPVLIQRSRAGRDGPVATQLLDVFKRVLGTPAWLQVGGNETVGMGWCAVTIIEQ